MLNQNWIHRFIYHPCGHHFANTGTKITILIFVLMIIFKLKLYELSMIIMINEEGIRWQTFFCICRFQSHLRKLDISKRCSTRDEFGWRKGGHTHARHTNWVHITSWRVIFLHKAKSLFAVSFYLHVFSKNSI